MNPSPFLAAMVATHLAYLLGATVAALFLRAIRKSVQRMAASAEARSSTTTRNET